MEASTNARVARNALALTIRMVIVTIVGLYTSRVVLQALGTTDYGIYAVVGGVVSMSAFLNAALASATSRFITIELARGTQQSLRALFSTAMYMHIAIAIVVIIIAETVGLWFVNTHMNFPPDRMLAVNVLYQISVFSVLISCTQVPYTAIIIAHERMTIYAYMELLNSGLKLAIVYILFLSVADRLIIYAFLTLASSILICAIYRVYCVRHFPSSRLTRHFDRARAREMLTFSSYNLFSNLASIARMQGIPVVINIFFGVIANTASGIALTVTGAVQGFTSSITMAFRPQITKQYALEEYVEVQNLLKQSVLFTLGVFFWIAIPVYVETPRLLYCWLGQIPPYTTLFLRLILIINAITLIRNNYYVAVHATGNIRTFSLVNACFWISVPLISYLVLYRYKSAIIPYNIDILINSLALIWSWFTTKRLIPALRMPPLVKNIVLIWIIAIVSCAITLWIAERFEPVSTAQLSSFLHNIWVLMRTALISSCIFLPILYFCAFSKKERFILRTKIQAKIHSVFSNHSLTHHNN